jgi:hypothetical protein
MQFVIIFGQGRFLSRHVHQVILDIIDRAMGAFSATGMNPDRYYARLLFILILVHNRVTLYLLTSAKAVNYVMQFLCS